MLIITDLRKRKLKIRCLGATLDKRMAVGFTFHPLIALTTLMFVWRCGIAQRRRAQIRRKRPRMGLAIRVPRARIFRRPADRARTAWTLRRQHDHDLKRFNFICRRGTCAANPWIRRRGRRRYS